MVRLKTIEAKLASYFINDILFYNDKTPYISITRNLPLLRSKEYIRDNNRRSLMNGTIHIPQKILDFIKRQFLERDDSFNEIHNKAKQPISILVADVENHLIRAFIFFQNSGFAHVRFKIDCSATVLSKLSATLSERQFNILQTNTRALKQGNLMLVDFLLNLPPEKDKLKNDRKLESFIASVQKSNQLKDYNVEVEFPGYSDKPKGGIKQYLSKIKKV